MTDQQSEAEAKPRRRRVSAPAAAIKAPATPEPAAGGFVGLWRTLNGSKDGAISVGDTGLTLAFVVCISAGTVLCLLGAFEQIPFARQIGFGGPLVATLAYPFWGWVIGAAKRPSLRERLADNSYYLGFIFTQIALLVGFLPAAFGTAELSADQIIRFFGVALGASLIGLVARTILIQMSYTVDEAADVVSGEVSALAREISRQTTAVLDQFDALVARLSSSQQTLVAELQSGMGSLSQTVAGYEATLKADSEALHVQTSSAVIAASETTKVVDQHQAKLADSVAAMAASIDHLNGSLEGRLSGAVDSIHATTEALQQGIVTLRGVGDLQAGLSGVETKITALDDRFTGLGQRIVAVSQNADASLSDLNTQIGEVGERNTARVAAVNAEAAQAVEALEATLASFRRELERLRG